MMEACVVCRWKGKKTGINKIHGGKPASVTGFCYSRWRPNAVFTYFVIKNWIRLYQNTFPVAGLTMAAFVVCRWKGKKTRINKIHGSKPAFVTGFCYSRWRPDAGFIHISLLALGPDYIRILFPWQV